MPTAVTRTWWSHSVCSAIVAEIKASREKSFCMNISVGLGMKLVKTLTYGLAVVLSDPSPLLQAEGTGKRCPRSNQM